MFDVLTQINWLAVLLAFVIAAAIGAVYFPILIAKPYLRALGRENADKVPSNAVRNIGPIACTLLVTITTAIFVRAMNITMVGDAVGFGLIAGVGYLAAMTFQIALNPNFPRPLLYGLINAPYFVVVAVVQAIVLALIR